MRGGTGFRPIVEPLLLCGRRRPRLRVPVDFQTKSGAEREVLLARPALDVHHSIRKRGKAACEPVLQHARGAIYPHHLSQCFAMYAWNAGLDGVGVRGLRHTVTSRLIERGVPVPIVQRFAGHADVAMTTPYCSIADDVCAGRIMSALGE